MEYFSQLGMEENCRNLIDLVKNEEDHRINSMMNPCFSSCNYHKKELTLKFIAEDWFCNPQGIVHGGISSTAMDLTMGLLNLYFVKCECFTPTISMNVQFLSPIPKNKTMLVTAHILRKGNSISHMEADCVLEENPNKICVKSTAEFFVGGAMKRNYEIQIIGE